MGVWHLLRRAQREEALEQGEVMILGEGWDPERMDLGASGGEGGRGGPEVLGKEWFLLGSGGGEKEYRKAHLEQAGEEVLVEDMEGEEADIDGIVHNKTDLKPNRVTRITFTACSLKGHLSRAVRN
jgi:hypothetical protein